MRLAAPDGGRGAVRGGGRWRRALAAGVIFALGFVVVMNLALDPTVAQSPRLLDLVGIAVLPGLVWRGLRLRLPLRLWVWGALAALVAAILLAAVLAAGDSGRGILILRVVLSVAVGVELARAALRHRAVTALACGFWAGAAGGVALAQAQALGIAGLVALLPVDAAVSSVLGTLRPSGLWGHPNAAAQVTMAGAAMILLCLGGRGLWPVAAFVAVALGNYAVMWNRAPLVVAAGVALVICWHLGGRRMRVAAGAAAMSAAAVLWLEPAAVLSERWLATFGGMTAQDQAAERLGTAMAGLAIAFERPLGHDTASRVARMVEETGMRAAHNGFVHAALVLGPWAAGALLALLVRAALAARGTAQATGVAYALGAICVMLMFEDAALEPSIVATLACVAALAALRGGGAVAAVGVEAPVTGPPVTGPPDLRRGRGLVPA